MPKKDPIPASGDITQTAVRFATSEYSVIKRAAQRRDMSVNAFITAAAFLAAGKVLQAASAKEELSRIVLVD